MNCTNWLAVNPSMLCMIPFSWSLAAVYFKHTFDFNFASLALLRLLGFLVENEKKNPLFLKPNTRRRFLVIINFINLLSYWRHTVTTLLYIFVIVVHLFFVKRCLGLQIGQSGFVMSQILFPPYPIAMSISNVLTTMTIGNYEIKQTSRLLFSCQLTKAILFIMSW